MAVTVVVPRGGTPLAQTVVARAAIVKSIHHDEADGQVLVYYEGNVFGMSNLQRFGDRLMSAAGRMLKRYPTSAMMKVSKDDVIPVGTFDEVTGKCYINDDSSRKLLVQWLGQLDDVELDVELNVTPTYSSMMRRRN